MSKSFGRIRILFLFLGVVVLVGVYRGFLNLQEYARLTSCMPGVTYHWATLLSDKESGFLPPLSSQPGKFHFHEETTAHFRLEDSFCEYDLTGPPTEILESVRDKDNRVDSSIFDDWSYFYIGYALQNDEQGLEFLRYYEEHIRDLNSLPDEIPITTGTGICGTDTIQRQKNLSEIFKEDCQSINSALIPVVIERPENHRKPGGQVTFLDGHTEFIPYPGKFPMTVAFMERLLEVDATFTND